MPCAAVTAWVGLTELGSLDPSHTVLAMGTGGVSIFALQFSKMVGASVIQTSSSDDKLARARELGADHGINYRSTPDWAAATRDLTHGRGVEQPFDVDAEWITFGTDTFSDLGQRSCAAP